MGQAILVDIRRDRKVPEGTLVDREIRNERCWINWAPRTGSIEIHYMDRDGVRTTSTVRSAVGSGNMLEVTTQNSVYRFQHGNAARAAEAIMGNIVKWHVLHSFAKAFA